MVQETLNLLPASLSTAATATCAACALASTGVWLAGARFSRSLLTLMAVLIGAAVGMQLPGWFPMRISSWATATGGALVFGIFAYAVHRFWVGLFLGALLAALAAFLLHFHFAPAHGAGVNWPAIGDGATVSGFLKSLWAGLPDDMRRWPPIAISMLFALATAIVIPRFATALLHSLAGATAAVVLGLVVVRQAQPQWLSALPDRSAPQELGFAAIVLLGVAIQWRQTRWMRPAAKPSSVPKEP